MRMSIRNLSPADAAPDMCAEIRKYQLGVFKEIYKVISHLSYYTGIILTK